MVGRYRGDPITALVQTVLGDGYDMLFKASEQGRGRSSHAISSFERRLLRVCPCPVTILRPLQSDRAGRILAPVGFDPDQSEKGAVNDVILEIAARAALASSRELHILHVWSLYGGPSLAYGRARIPEEQLNELHAKEEKVHQDWLEALVKECLDKFGPDAVQYLAPKVHLLTGSPHQVIPEQVEVLRPDLMVIGSIARTGLPGFLMGNTAEAILDEVDCSVTTVKPPGFESPIHL